MSTLDIRKETGASITEIQFDDTGDRLRPDNCGNLMFLSAVPGTKVCLVTPNDTESIENFIKAVRKAHELWGQP